MTRGWRVLAGVEVAGAAVAVLADWFVPSLVLVGMATLSLVVRRDGPGSLGFRRPPHPWRLAGQMLLVSLAVSLLDVGLLMPIANHVSGTRQDLSDFADLQGNLVLLALFIVLGWTLAALVEETAFRGYVFTRLTDVLGVGSSGVAVSLVLSSVLFAAIHSEQGVVGQVVAGVDALLYGALRVWKATLWAPVLTHGFVDTVGFVAFFLVGPTYGLW
ncbi:lysostaphin resistance A-like protein [Nocardioides sp.]|uniref:CPBP family intramembrane glutamic endopeptidase n=1 Tax=Nocardioides sp. TaxID=35761 RepID=UPI003D0FD7AE